MPDTRRIPGQDQIDLDDNQDILITPCVMGGRAGWILPVFKGTWDPNPAGHFPKNIIEISLMEELPNLAPGLTDLLKHPGSLGPGAICDTSTNGGASGITPSAGASSSNLVADRSGGKR